MQVRLRSLWIAVFMLAMAAPLQAELKLANVFTDHMVLQRDLKNPVWGWDTPGTKVTVSLDGQSHSTQVDDSGRWQVKLDPLKAGGPHKLTIQGTSTREIQDVLVGEVWVCSGQSNMQWSVSSSNDPDLESLTAKFPQIRLLTVPNRASQNSETQFEGKWLVCSPETVNDFSGIGYFFGRQLHQTLDVPIGLIDNAWGGSAAEAWVNRDVLKKRGNTTNCWLAGKKSKRLTTTTEPLSIIRLNWQNGKKP